MVPSDAPAVSALDLELGYAYPECFVEGRISRILEQTKDILLVAEYDGTVAGYVHAMAYELTYQDPLLNICSFVVGSSLRSRGIGSLLLEQLEQIARREGFTGIRLVSEISRLQAHAFYESHGFMHKKTQKQYLKIL
jgi:ribosomal protein S18 acetylase RimI-like enzyme